MLDLSIIVPVYGVEDYIEQCISTLLVHGFYNYEIIVVNDGTKDRSIDIVKEKFSDSRIRIVEQENAGLSAARNHGIQEAKGEYVWMFDSDDWADNKSLERILNQFDGSFDVLYLTSYYLNYEDTGIQQLVTNPCSVTNSRDLICSNFEHPAPFYIYRRKLLQEHQLYFTEGIYHEDSLFTPIALSCVKTVKCDEVPIYHYRQRGGSITKSFSQKRVHDLLFVLKSLVEFGENKIPVDVRYQWGRCIVSVANGLLKVAHTGADNDSLKLIANYVNRNWAILRYLRNSGNRNNVIMGYLATLFAGNLTLAYKILYKLRY